MVLDPPAKALSLDDRGLIGSVSEAQWAFFSGEPDRSIGDVVGGLKERV